MNDMQAAREAAERIIEDNDSIRRGLSDEQWAAMLKMGNDDLLVARDYLSLTDPTPLTVEKLVEAGGKRGGKNYYVFPMVSIHTYGEDDANYWSWSVSTPPARSLVFPPRTVGELRQLLLRMEGQS